MQQTPIIGIVGGVGPYAGLDMVQKIFEQTQAQSDQEHLPVALLSFPGRIADRTEYLEGRVDQNPGKALAGVLLQLEQIGATVAGIPCNTAHAPRIFDYILAKLKKAGSRIHLYHLIDECVAYIRKQYPQVQRVGVLSTTGTWRFGLYTQALQRQGLQPLAPPEDLQTQLVHPAIYDPSYGIKAQSDPIHARASRQLQQAMQYLQAQGAQAVILGCTELPLAFRTPAFEGIPLIDPTRILARRLILATAPHKLREHMPGRQASF